MLLGIHTIAWGERVDLDEMLSVIKSTGYQGAELFQDPQVFEGGIDSVIQAYQRHNVHLIGTCAGSFRERLDLVRAFCEFHRIEVRSPSAPYIYIDEWYGDATKDALVKGYRIALHPHMYMAIQTLKEADALLTAHPSLLFLPDTAHLTVAGEDSPRNMSLEASRNSTAIVEAIRKRSSQLAAVHLKDWSEEVGRSYQFYADGFCPFGEGNVKLKEVLLYLWKSQYPGWIVVEHDRVIESPKQTATESLEWIMGILPPGFKWGALDQQHA